MTIIFSMKNVTSELAHTVMLRKFFQMVFVGEDKKSLHIYTATVLGASDQKLKNKEDDSGIEEKEYISDLKKLNQFRMHFDFAIACSDDNELKSIKHEDITGQKESDFLNEIECIRNVWGTKCEVLQNDQNQLMAKYKELLDTKYNTEDEEEIRKLTAQIAKYKVLWTEQRKNGEEDCFLKSLSMAGVFEELQEMKASKAREEIAGRKAYTIGVPQNCILPKGMELVNWVRTTIEFKYPFEDIGHNFLIQKDSESEEGCSYLSPDFTWYFSPVIKSYIDSRNSTVEVKYGTKERFDVCECPIKKRKRTFYRNDKFQNGINSVPNKMTVNFSYWTDEEKIQYRQKYRLAARDVFPRVRDINEMSQISIFLDTSDEHNRGNRQFLVGVFLSIALAFGIDSTRLATIAYCFTPLNFLFTEDIWWIAFLLLFSLSWMNKPLKLSIKSRKMMKWRSRNLECSMLWFFCVFAVLRIPLLEPVIEKYKTFIGWGFGITCCGLMLSHLLYIWNKSVRMGGNLLKDLLGEDIL